MPVAHPDEEPATLDDEAIVALSITVASASRTIARVINVACERRAACWRVCGCSRTRHKAENQTVGGYVVLEYTPREANESVVVGKVFVREGDSRGARGKCIAIPKCIVHGSTTRRVATVCCIAIQLR
jgi:hypothetical protein